ncbi:hypothetical protein W97_08090 [Coniosporium apollinis CBS 100218]|uniref:3-dehydroquinate dehydratase I n=1 Tax=Coniosporium apollinis (strain CBS 100218) TaxID=1168221 RepID=R7Z3T7_CONA1|nr:uncharacterized protein W97_08090 [Coniosporium apollinis CBS 100218]EON68832.1 hypothetical protein W97_08090 [Coniosporium apollinis CBS 100218]
MATKLQTSTAVPALPEKTGVVEVQELGKVNKPTLLVIYGQGQEEIVSVIADVLGQPWILVQTLEEAEAVAEEIIAGILDTSAAPGLEGRSRTGSRLVINTHCVDGDQELNEVVSSYCDHEYLYTQSPFYRRDVARFFAFILGQSYHYENLAKKAKTTLLSMTFPDVRTALPNLDILSVGADVVELRVDLLKEPLADGSFSPVPSLKYVGEQFMILRQRTELPIIFTTRCTNENGRFPMDNPDLFFTYLYKAMQWGCEYIDVELWLPEHIRQRLAERKGHSKIISAFHDFSGNFKWTSPQAQELFTKGAVYGDVVKMIALIHNMQDNYELEYFRSTIQSQHSHPPLSGLNMGPVGQLSRALNKVFTPVTHPLLPMIAAPGQLSAAEINSALHSMGQMPKLDFYGIGSFRSTTQAMFYEKCFNELSLPHQLMFVERKPKGSVEATLRRPNFGGAYINPPLAVPVPYLPSLSDAAKIIGQVDTVVVNSSGGSSTFTGENATWKGIRATLSRDFVPSAYSGRAALLLASSGADAAPAIFALKSLGIGPVYTIGFKIQGSLAIGTQPVRSVEDVKVLEQPFALISALPADKSLSVGPLLKYYSANGRNGNRSAGKVFVDLASGPRKVDSLGVAASLGWTAYGIADVSAWTAVETMRLLVGQNVPYDFVRLASGRSLY